MTNALIQQQGSATLLADTQQQTVLSATVFPMIIQLMCARMTVQPPTFGDV